MAVKKIKKPAKKTVSGKKKAAKKSVSKKTKRIKPAKKSTKKSTKKVSKTSKRLPAKKKQMRSIREDDDFLAFDESESDDVESLTAEEIDREIQDYEAVKAKTVSRGSKQVTAGGAQELARQISRFMFEKKAEEVVLADLGGLTSVTDYFVLATATSDLHARAVADHVVDSLEAVGIRPHHKEGYSSFKWILIDYVDVVVHIFQKDARAYYDLERLWGDAKFSRMRDE